MATRSIAPLQFRLRPGRPLRTHPSYVCPSCRYAATKATSPSARKPNQPVLAKPDKFRPPSHPSRRVTRQPRNFGPALTAAELTAQKTKQYPNMFPPEGTVMHKVLTTRSLHVYVTLGVLVTLAGYATLLDFWAKNKFPDALPPRALFFEHPLRYLAQYARVYRMHVEALSVETAEKRRRQAEEGRKRHEYFKYHGVVEESLLEKWGLGLDETPEEKRRREEEQRLQREAIVAAGGVVPQKKVRLPAAVRDGLAPGEDQTYREFDGQTRKVKKWFGIW